MSCSRRGLHVLAAMVTSMLFAACAGSVVSHPHDVGAYVDERGDPVSLALFRGEPYVLSAVYTSCTERCPLTIQKLREIDDALRAEGHLVPIVLLTLDPRVDTPERLKWFKLDRDLPDHWRLLRGDVEHTRALARSIGLSFVDDGHIDHDTRIAVFDSEGRLVRSFSGWSFDKSAAVSAVRAAAGPR